MIKVKKLLLKTTVKIQATDQKWYLQNKIEIYLDQIQLYLEYINTAFN